MSPAHRHHTTDWCTFVRERTELFLDGELTGSENLAFTTHLKECDDCAAAWADDEQLCEALLIALPDAPAAGPATAPAAVLDDDGASAYSRRASDVIMISRGRPAIALGVLAVAASVIAVVFVLRFLDDGTVIEGAPAEVPYSVALAAGDVRMQGEDGLWRQTVRGAPVEAGTTFRTGDEAAAVLQLAEAGSIVMDPASTLAFDETENGAVTARLETGRLTGDFEERAFSIEAGVVTVSGSSAAFVLVAPTAMDPRGWVAVTRGDVTAYTGGDRRVISAGEVVATRGHTLFDVEAFDRVALQGTLAQALDLERRKNLSMAELLETAHDEIAELERRVENLAKAIPVPRRPDSVAAVISEYLATVERIGYVFVGRPTGFAVETVEKLQAFGPSAIPALERAYLAENAPLRRRAIVGLLAGLETPQTIEPLKIACAEDEDDRVREEALLVLAQSDFHEIAPFLLDRFEIEKKSHLRLLAAWGAARLGSDEGFRSLTALYHEARDGWSRRSVVRKVIRLKDDPRVVPFLHSILRSWDRVRSNSTLRMIVCYLGEQRSIASVGLLREIAESEGLEDDFRNRIREALLKIEG